LLQDHQNHGLRLHEYTRVLVQVTCVILVTSYWHNSQWYQWQVIDK